MKLHLILASSYKLLVKSETDYTQYKTQKIPSETTTVFTEQIEFRF